MRVPRIYSAEPLVSSPVILGGSTANYLGRVLRLKITDNLMLFDGRGGYWLAEITELNKQRVYTRLVNFFPDNNTSSLSIELGQCISRGDRMDYAIQKATEMGVARITPLFGDRSEVKLNELRQIKRVQHWRQIAVSACEQCGRNVVPVIDSPRRAGEWISDRCTDLNLICSQNGAGSLSEYKHPESVSILIGPEGGFSDEEMSLVKKRKFDSMSLGPRILRTETAPVAALAILQYLWGDG